MFGALGFRLSRCDCAIEMSMKLSGSVRWKMRVSIRKKIFAFVVIPRRSSKRWIVEWSFARNVIVTQLYTFTISWNVETIINFVTSSQGDKLNKDEYELKLHTLEISWKLLFVTFHFCVIWKQLFVGQHFNC